MKKQMFLVAAIALGVSWGMTRGAANAGAQGPAGAGASTASKDTSKDTSHSSHSLNPIKWIKKDKDSKNSVDSNASRGDVEKKLTPKLQAAGLLPANLNATNACATFTSLEQCVAALHVSRNLGLEFNCIAADVTGVHTNVDLSGCKGPVGEKAQDLRKSIHILKPDADAKGAAKTAEQQAKDDLKDLGS
jgi:hypothetical protein